MTLRRAIFWCHLACGTVAGLIILSMSATGVLLAFEPQLAEYSERDVRIVSPPGPGAARLDAETLVARARAARPDVRPPGLVLRADPTASAIVQFGREGALFVDPYRGTVLGGPSRLHEIMHTLVEWHRWLGSREPGRPITGVCSLAFMGLALSGLLLWWPRSWSRHMLRGVMWFAPRLRGRARDWNWHNTPRGRPMVVSLGLLLAAVAALGPVPSAAQSPAPPAGEADPAQVILHILDYVAVDYPGAVKDGKVLDEGEYKEQLEFVTQARALFARLAPRPERADLETRADRLIALVRDKRPDTDVATLAGELRWALIAAYQVSVAPRRAPDLRQGAALFAAQCALCHGATGHGDGPAGKSLEPKPSDFHDAERMAQRSLYSLYSTITLGVEGTAMVGFRALSEDERWALAFHVAGLGTPAAERRRGMALWNAGKGRTAFPDLASIATRSPRELEARHGADAPALLAFLRDQPDALSAKGNAALATSLRLLRDSVEAYRQGRAREAQDLAVSSYLDGFELAEPSLDAVDRGLRTEVEAEMLRFRGLVKDGAPLPAVEAQARKLEAMLARAREALEVGGLPPGAAFTSAFIILLREGLEAILVVAAIIALLVKAGRRDALPWVHAGWIVALLLGGLTWWLASYVVSISGATREMTEGVTALVAAAVLLYVGFWMHGKSHASRWQEFLEARLAGALSARAMRALGFLSFLAVYREVFETVLFYEALATQAGPGSSMALLGGLATAVAALLVLAWVIVRGSLRMPLGLFFGASSVLIALLAIVFAGKGIAALQEAGVLPVHSLNVPAVPLIGLYPNAESLVVQAVLLVVVAVGFAWSSRSARSARAL